MVVSAYVIITDLLGVLFVCCIVVSLYSACVLCLCTLLHTRLLPTVSYYYFFMLCLRSAPVLFICAMSLLRSIHTLLCCSVITDYIFILNKFLNYIKIILTLSIKSINVNFLKNVTAVDCKTENCID